MSAFLGDVASAALPVAIALLLAAAAACGVLWVEVDGARAQRQARLYLEPLSTWCLIALAVYVVAHITAGGSLLVLFLPLGLAVLAALLRSADETDEPAEGAATRGARTRAGAVGHPLARPANPRAASAQEAERTGADGANAVAVRVARACSGCGG